MHEKQIGLEVVVRQVSGFYDAKSWIYRLIDAGIVPCTQCKQPATHVYWVDRAEWYPHCNDHRDYGDQWIGGTNWNPSSFSLTVIPDAAKQWYAALPPEEQTLVKLREYDATPYWELLDDSFERERIYLRGSREEGFWTYTTVRRLTDGQFIYDITRGHGSDFISSEHTGAFIGMFGSVEAAVEHARISIKERN